MLFALSHATDRPIYAQIGDRVKFAVVAGVLRPGELVPSVRELSKQLVVNPNTVARAYRDLQVEGILEPVRGTGLMVGPRAVDICRDDRREFVRQRLRGVIGEIRQSGLPADEVLAILRSEWEAGAASANGQEQHPATSGVGQAGGDQ